MTQKELKFLEHYLTGGLTIEKAMIAAGYVGYHLKSLYRIDRKIVEKHEQQAGDHRKIMRQMGYGEVKVIEMMIEAATKFKSETVRQKALETLGKWLGLQTEEFEGGEGITIVIQAAGSPGDQPRTPGQDPPKTLPPQKPGFRVIK